jgi:nucleosome binding factor SPN SPT16 subunit
MSTSVSRTLLIGPSDIQKKAYLFIHDVFEYL